MRLVECLNQCDMGQLALIARSHRLIVPTYSKSAILQELLIKFTDSRYLSDRLTKQPSLQKIIRELAINGRDHYAKDELSAVIRRMLSVLAVPDLDAKETIIALRQEGFLYEIGNRSGRMYIFPEDVWKKLHALVSVPQANSLATVAKLEPIIIRNDESALARDATSFLFYCAKSPLPLTVAGGLYKRAQQQLMQLFEIQEELLPERTGWRFGFHPHYRHYPARFALIYDFWLKNGAIIEKSGYLEVAEGAGQALLMIVEEKRSELLFRYYLEAYRNAIPNLAQAVKKISEMAYDVWVYEAAIKAELSPWINDYYYASRDLIVSQHLLLMLVDLGFLKIGELRTGEPVYQLSEYGKKWVGPHLFRSIPNTAVHEPDHSSEKVVITANFEILVPADIEARYGFDLRHIATQVKSDRMRVFRLTKESIRRAVTSGWTRQQIAMFLEHLSQYPIPQNVLITLNDWTAAAGKQEPLHE